MHEDSFFRYLMLAVCCVFMPLGLYHRFRSYTGERIDRRQEGFFILFGLRLTALVVVVASIAWMINPAWMAWARLPLPSWLRWAGVIIACVSGVCWVWAVHTLGKNLTDTVITREGHTLITNGPYRWIRHPFYTSCLVGLVGGSLAMANWFIMLMGSIVWFVFLLPRTSIEEQNLITRFGDEYREYMQHTGRFLPSSRN